MKLGLVWPRPSSTASAVGPASGGYLYDAELERALRRQAVELEVHELDDGAVLHDLRRVDAVVIDGLAAPLVTPQLASLSGRRFGLIHMTPTVDEVQRRFFAALDGVLFVSASVRDETAARFQLPSRVALAPPGIDHVTPLARTPGPLLLSVAHVLPHKGVLEALEVFAELHRRAPARAWRVRWLGGLDRAPGYTAAVLERRAALGLEARVTFEGQVSLTDVVAALSNSTALVSTSEVEAWGLGAAEALACGVPLVSWTRGGVFTQAAEERAGVFVALGDVAGMATALEALLTDVDLRQGAEVAARRCATSFSSWDACARAVVSACS